MSSSPPLPPFFNRQRTPIFATHGAAATSHSLASAEALSVLRAGGSAADAAIAACAVQCVVEPHMTGIGGDCFALVKTPQQTPLALNGSGYTPEKLSLEWLKKIGINNEPCLSETSAHTVTIPGAVSAWKQLHDRFGRLPWRGLFQAAINYAEQGYPVTPRVAWDWRQYKTKLKLDSDCADIFLVKNETPTTGDIHYQKKLGATLKTISEDGGESFYRGDIAKKLVNKLNRAGAPHTLDDFANYEACWENAIFGEFRDWTIWQCPPNGQGLVVLLMLALLNKEKVRDFDIQRLQRFLEISRYAYHWRDQHLGDTKANWQDLVRKAVTTEQGNMIAPSPPTVEHKDTVYLSIIDGRGMAVSLINSLFHPFGSGIVEAETGVLFHNRGLSFSLEGGHPNALMGRKRPMHTIIPALAENQSGDLLSFGMMGGHYQAAGQAWFLSRLFDDGDDLQAALDAPRFLNYPHQLEVEADFPLQKELKAAGHSFQISSNPIGGGQAVLRKSNGVLIAASDSRKDGQAIGF